MIKKPYKANKSTPSGDSERPRSFPDGNKPRMFADKSKKKIAGIAS